MKKTILITIAILLAIVYILSTLNRIFVTEPRIQSAVKDVKIETIKSAFAECTIGAGENYDHMWEASCSDLGEGANCMLAPSTANTYNKILKEAKDNCLEIYKLELGAIK